MTPRVRAAAAWTLVAAVLVYAGILYLGLGPVPPAGRSAPWEPSGFLRTSGALDALALHPTRGVLAISLLPAIGTALLLAGRSSLALALACAGTVTSGLFAFYGLTGALRVWAFFGWRGSLVIVATGVVAGAALAAPALADRWWRLPVPWKIVTYGPIYLVVTSLIRDATGSDPQLPLNLSPWPAVAVFGLEIFAYAWVGLMLGGGLGTLVSASSIGYPLRRLVGIAIASVLPVAWFLARFPHTGAGALGWLFGVAIVVIVSAVAAGSLTPTRWLGSARALGLAAALVALPVLGGRALAEGDHVVSRYVRAQSIIEALAWHYDEYDAYPDDLADLVAAGQVDHVPAPRVGHALYAALGLFDRPEFIYQNLGTSYLLEFASTAWVTCSYSPPWRDLDEDESGEDDDLLRESWACPAGRPKLW